MDLTSFWSSIILLPECSSVVDPRRQWNCAVVHRGAAERSGQGRRERPHLLAAIGAGLPGQCLDRRWWDQVGPSGIDDNAVRSHAPCVGKGERIRCGVSLGVDQAVIAVCAGDLRCVVVAVAIWQLLNVGGPGFMSEETAVRQEEVVLRGVGPACPSSDAEGLCNLAYERNQLLFGRLGKLRLGIDVPGHDGADLRFGAEPSLAGCDPSSHCAPANWTQCQLRVGA